MGLYALAKKMTPGPVKRLVNHARFSRWPAMRDLGLLPQIDWLWQGYERNRQWPQTGNAQDGQSSGAARCRSQSPERLFRILPRGTGRVEMEPLF